ncbi:MAG: hypothetical protein GWO38_31770 [Phycisphaerae bacterium]|nr:hypothetical protein [Phycisphaerae bacterium]NIW99668.1 hypothetical protein [Phycisphaerae bacterium]NIX32081.1 hypothetical protein [Phycisphaerae bacterium]
MKKCICCLIAVLLFAFSARGLVAGAWTQKHGEGYYKIGFRFVRADRFYESTGNQIDIPTFGDYTVNFYGEYGLNDRLTLIVSVPFFKRITLNKQVSRGTGFVFFDGDSKSGFADFDIGLRMGLLRKGGAVLSTEALLGVPVGDNTQKNGLYTGDGEFDQSLKLQFGYSFFPVPAYFTSEVGMRNRNEGYSDEFRYAAEIGYTLGGKFIVVFKVRGVESLNNGADNVTGGMGGLFANNQSYLAYGPEISFLLSHVVGFTAAIEGAARGENVLSAPAYSIGVFLRR